MANKIYKSKANVFFNSTVTSHSLLPACSPLFLLTLAFQHPNHSSLSGKLHNSNRQKVQALYLQPRMTPLIKPAHLCPPLMA